MNSIKTVFVNVKGIDWDLEDEDGVVDVSLPINVDELLVEIDEDIDPYEKYTEDGSMCGFEVLCEAVVEELSTQYGFCLYGIDEVVVLRVEQN
jgi:hypothetical protein